MYGEQQRPDVTLAKFSTAEDLFPAMAWASHVRRMQGQTTLLHVFAPIEEHMGPFDPWPKFIPTHELQTSQNS